MRTQRNGVALPPRDRPQVTDPDQIDNWRRYAKLRTQLYPYISAAEAEYRRSRPAADAPPHARATRAIRRPPAVEDEFLFGPDILAAPVARRGADRARRLPARGPLGRPLALGRLRRGDRRARSSARPRCSTAARGHAARAARGAAAARPRAARCCPLLPPDVDTLGEAGHGPEHRGLDGSPPALDLLAFPGERIERRFNRRGNTSRASTATGWRLKLKAPRSARASSFRRRFPAIPGGLEPCSVELNGARFSGSAWSFDAASGVLAPRSQPRRAKLIVVKALAGSDLVEVLDVRGVVGFARAARRRTRRRGSRSSSAAEVVRRLSARTFASFQRRAPSAVAASAQSAARMPGTLLAAIDAPVPVQQQTMPCSARPSATSRAAASDAQAQSSRSSS